MLENPTGDLTEFLTIEGQSNLAVMIILGGAFDCTINHSHYFVAPATMAIMPGISYIGNAVASNDFRGYLISIDHEFLDRLHINSSSVMNWRKENEIKVVRLAKKEIRSIRLFITLLQDVMDAEDSEINREILRLQAKSLSCKILETFKRSQVQGAQDEDTSRKDDLSKKFIDLVHKHAIGHRDLSFYADQLCITPKYLSSIISKTTGKKATKWIEDYVMVQAMHMLKTTDFNISQISDALNFQSPSDFCRCFRKCTGMTPRQYRKLA